MKKLFLILTILLAVISCQSPEETAFLPDHIRNIHIPMFRNETFKFGLEEIVTNKVLSRFLADGRVNITTEAQASGVVYGTITRYVSQALQHNENDEVLQYRIRVYIKLEFFDKTQGKMIWVEDAIDRFVSYSEIVEPIETEREAHEKISELLANDVFTRVIEGWANIVK